MKPTDLAVSAEAHHERHGVWALSFWTVPGLSATEIAGRVGTSNLPHPKIRWTPAGRLRELGYEVMYSEPPPMHVSVILPSPPPDTTWTVIGDAFEPAADNPVARPRRP